MKRGIWGTGWVTGVVEDDDPDTHDAVEIGYWLSEKARRAVELFVPVDIPLFNEPVTAEELFGVGINDLEVQRAPQGSNPSWVSKKQLTKLAKLLEWPDQIDYGTQITVSQAGAGFGDPRKNLVVEAAAMAAVIEFYGDDWHCKDVSKDKVGWDLTFTHKKSKSVARVEVKGVSGSAPIVLLTTNEIKAAHDEDDWSLAVVTRALRDPSIFEYTAEQAVDASAAYVYRADMRSVTGT